MPNARQRLERIETMLEQDFRQEVAQRAAQMTNDELRAALEKLRDCRYATTQDLLAMLDEIKAKGQERLNDEK